MKKMIVAGLLALAVMATAEQKASAWCRFNWSCGCNMSWESTGCNYTWCFTRTCNPPPACYTNACFAGAPAFGGYAAAPQYNYPAQPAYAATAPATQQVGYFYYGQNYQAPSYWYGY